MLRQAAGHGALRVEPGQPDRVAKPTNATEVAMYEHFASDPALEPMRPFISEFFGAREADTLGGQQLRWAQEVVLENLCHFPDEPDRSYSTPSVLDVKVGRCRYTPATAAAKVKRIELKDKGTTVPTLALRICGVAHSRRVFAATQVGPGSSSSEAGSGDDASDAKGHSGDDDVSASDDEEDDDEGTEARGFASVGTRDALHFSFTKPEGIEEPWTEDKELGRSVTPAQFDETLARFFTLTDYRLETEPAQDTPLQARLAPRPRRGRFAPAPHPELVSFYRGQLRDLLCALDTGVLARYSFVSSSLIFVHQFHVPAELANGSFVTCGSDDAGRSPSAAAAGVPTSQEFLRQTREETRCCTRWRARMKIVDFSSSGQPHDGTAFPDDVIGFRDGVVSFIAAMDRILALYT